jgi:hypothetical protein
MRTRQAILILGAVVVATLVALWLKSPKQPRPGDTNLESPTTGAPTAPAAVARVAPNPAAANPVLTNAGRPGTGDHLVDAVKAYQQGLIGKGEAMLEAQRAENLKPQDFYGKVVDQYGQPVPGVEATGNLMIMGGLGDGAEPRTLKTQSDAQGLFQFTGIKGWQLGVVVKKDGYEIGARGQGYTGPTGERTSPNDRATFTMWKLRGAEPLIHTSIESRIPYDGTPVTFNLETGRKVADSSADLRLSLLRTPLQIRRGRDKYDWDVRIEIINGQILADDDPYPYWAPESGYQPFFETGISSNAVPWSAEMNRGFYFKGSQGQYGRLFIGLSTDSMRSDTGISIQAWINPSGSQNLEFDPAQLIR